MGDFQAIDIGLGLMFIYLVLSLVCTGINEFVAGIFQRRRRNLLKGLEFILAHEYHTHLTTAFRGHPLIQTLYGKNFKTSYIPPKIFSSVLLDLLHPGNSRTPTNLDAIQNNIESKKGYSNSSDISPLYQTLKLLIRESEADINKLKAKIEDWYNEAMVGTSGRYRTRTQLIVFAIALGVAFGANADTFSLIQTLSQNPEMRSALADQAIKTGESVSDAQPPESQPSLKDLKNSGLSLGWETFPPQSKDFDFKKFMGLLITAIAISLGAPFWFDLLKKVANVRAGSLSPDEVEKEKKKTQRT